MAQLNFSQVTLITKHGSAANWEQLNPILREGELGAELDTGLLKIGDGINYYNDLPYLNITPNALSIALQSKLDITGGIVTGALTLNYNPTAQTDAVTKGYVDALVASAGNLKREIVEELPDDEDADQNTIYMIRDNTSPGPDYYKEYLLINNTLTQIGDTSVDLTGVLRIPEEFNEGDLAAFDANGNLISVDASGIQGSTNVNDLIQDAGDELILYGGTASTVI